MSTNSTPNPLREKRIQLNTGLAQALNIESQLTRPLYKVDYNGDLYKVTVDGSDTKVNISTSADIVQHSIMIYLIPEDGSKPTQLVLGANMITLFAEYNVLLYKQAYDNETERDEYIRNNY